METVLSIGLSNAVTACGLALIAALCGRLWRRPAVVHGLWLLVLIKLLTPPLLPVQVAWPQDEEAVANETVDAGSTDLPLVLEIPAEALATEPPLEASGFVDAEPESTPVAVSLTQWAASLWQPLLLLIWVAGAVAWLVLAAVRSIRFRRLLRFADPAPLCLQAHVANLAARLGLRTGPSVWLLPGRLSPMLWPLGRTMGLILPSGLLKRLTPEQLDALLVHELAHCKRGDHWIRGVELLATALYWWHPVVWWARRELREAEEQCCDAWVIWALPATRRAYALALVETVDFLSEARPLLPALASGLGHVHDLKRRVTMIMRGATPRLLGWVGLLMLLGLAVAALPLLPVLAQDRPAPTPIRPGEDRKPEERRPDSDHNRVEVRELEEKLLELRTKVRETEEQLERARRRVTDNREVIREERVILRLQGPDGKVQTIELPPGTRIVQGQGGGGGSGTPGGVGGGPPMGGGPSRGGPMGSPGGSGGPPTAGGGRSGDGDLQRKVEDLTRQIEELRRQFRNVPLDGPDGGGPRGGGGRAPTTPPAPATPPVAPLPRGR